MTAAELRLGGKPVTGSEKTIGNLSLETTEDELRKEFIEFGEVLSVTIMNDRYIGSGQPRGYGYVEMALKSEGTSAVANLEGKMLGHRYSRIFRCR